MAFDYPLRRNTLPTRQRNLGHQMREERRKPQLPTPYIWVSGGTGGTVPDATWQSPEWKNSFTFVGSRYVGFRHGLDGDVEFIGQLDLTAGAVTGTVAFNLPVPWRGLSFEFVFPIFTGGTDWINGILQVTGGIGTGAGDVTVYWPVQATPI